MAILTQMIEAVGARLDCLIMGNCTERAFPDYITAFVGTVGRGFVGAGRVGDWESSRGGFATGWIGGRTARSKAAVADAYRAHSPIMCAHRCATPTMLPLGEGDRRLNIGEAEQFRRAWRDVGCAMELFRIAQMVVACGPLSVLGQEHS